MNFKKISQNLTKNAVPAVAGGVAAVMFDKVAPSMQAKLGKARPFVKLAIGAILPELMPKQKFLVPASQGFLGVAGADLAKTMMPSLNSSTQAIEGIGTDNIDEEYEIEGFDDDVISGIDDNSSSIVSGTGDSFTS